MENILLGFILVIGIIVITSVINERKLHIPHEVALMIIAFVISLGILGIQKFNLFGINEIWHEWNILNKFHLEHFLLECLISFMMFAGASKAHFQKFVKNILPIGYLAIFTTLISAVSYGVLFYGANCLLKLDLNIWHCLLLGSVISATDSLVSTMILNKKGVSKSLLSVMEGESFFNDGIGVAIFIFATEMLRRGMMQNILFLILQEFIGAILVGFIVSYILFKLLKMSNEPIVHILISILAVSLSIAICEYCGFSGIIASVVCGMYFSYQNKKVIRWREVVDSKDLYNDFWGVFENLLNSILCVLVGLSVISMEFHISTLILIPISVLLNLLSRWIGVGISTIMIGKKKIPGHYSFKEFVSLMTWGGLKGGLSLALIMSAKDILSTEIYEILLNMTMITILFTTIIQGLTISRVYQKIEIGREEKRIRIRN